MWALRHFQPKAVTTQVYYFFNVYTPNYYFFIDALQIYMCLDITVITYSFVTVTFILEFWYNPGIV